MKARNAVLLTTLFCLVGASPGWTTDEPMDFVAGTKILKLDASDYGPTKPDKGMFVIVKRGGTAHPGPSDDLVLVLDKDGAKLFEHTPGLDVPGAWLVNVRDAALRDPRC